MAKSEFKCPPEIEALAETWRRQSIQGISAAYNVSIEIATEVFDKAVAENERYILYGDSSIDKPQGRLLKF